eukprot:CAMPEP_0117014352 /NCGR_PEP_ID=MMETSP0472-20121206/11659_1 /TAXON_ID=693140 ORGANISM="Tiarina fusus, Strain LIS" /NCGR_SAMPLE_ID=MMETSP0472 /ASSEMBLY_ACC=CAM_ASM_000603 /LENGTH=275 /DNA_ID=CAMNT_0004717889 /DNA_START=252 /DNA_END=1079 /DNA_ORIENTATION=+
MDFTCVIAALLFFTGNAILLAFYIREAGREHFDYDEYTNLDVETLRAEWDFREQHRPKVLAAGIINGLAWFFFAFPMIQLAWILSQRGSKSLWLHISIAVLALVGSFTEWISRLLYIGASMAGLLIKNDFELDTWVQQNDGIGWKALEVSHVMTQGLIIFIDAFEWICLFIILVFVHISVRRWRSHDSVTFGACWNSLGLFIGLLCLLDFVAEVLRLDGFKLFGQIAFWYAAVNRLILIPMWLLMLGCRLPYAAMKLNEMAVEPTVIDAQNTNQR